MTSYFITKHGISWHIMIYHNIWHFCRTNKENHFCREDTQLWHFCRKKLLLSTYWFWKPAGFLDSTASYAALRQYNNFNQSNAPQGESLRDSDLIGVISPDVNVLLLKKKTISDGGITVDFRLSKSILLIDHRIAGDHRIPGDHRIAAAGIIE